MFLLSGLQHSLCLSCAHAILYLYGIEYTIFAFFSPNLVLAVDFNQFSLVPGKNSVFTSCLDAIPLKLPEPHYLIVVRH